MEDIISYTILFVFGLTAVFLYQKHRTKQRNLPLSIQHFPDLILKVIVQKQFGKTQKLVVKITARDFISISKISVELIDKKRKIEMVEINIDKVAGNKPISINKSEHHYFYFNPESFSEFLKNQDIPYSTFRFVINNSNGTKFKSHDLAFNKNWLVYRPDSGTYN